MVNGDSSKDDRVRSVQVEQGRSSGMALSRWKRRKLKTEGSSVSSDGRGAGQRRAAAVLDSAVEENLSWRTEFGRSFGSERYAGGDARIRREGKMPEDEARMVGLAVEDGEEEGGESGLEPASWRIWRLDEGAMEDLLLKTKMVAGVVGL